MAGVSTSFDRLHVVPDMSELRGKQKELLRVTVINHLAEVESFLSNLSGVFKRMNAQKLVDAAATTAFRDSKATPEPLVERSTGGQLRPIIDTAVGYVMHAAHVPVVQMSAELRPEVPRRS